MSAPVLSTNAPSLGDLARPFGVTDRGLTFPSDGVRLSYDDIARQAATGGRYLTREGVRPGDAVAMTLSNNSASVIGAMSVWVAGGTLVSVPPVPRHAEPSHLDGVRQALTAMGCRTYLADGAAPEAFHAMRVIDLPLLIGQEWGRFDRDPDLPPADMALVQFTSGSLGTAKGVAVSAEKLAGHLHAIAEHTQVDGERDRCFSWLPFYHDMGFVGMLLTCFGRRVDTTFVPPGEFAAAPARWMIGVAQTGATLTGGPDFAYRLAASAVYPEGLDVSSIRVCLSGAERVQWPSLTGFHNALAPAGLRWEAIGPCYGMAEGVVAATMTPLGRGPILGPNGHVSSGVPIPGVRLDAAPGPEPEPMRLGGDYIFDGYITASGFQPQQGEWFDTGDAGFMHEGELYVRGRLAEVITAAGRNVFAEDVEAVALRAGAPSVQAAAAFRYGPSGNRFAAVVELNHRLRPTHEDAQAVGQKVKGAVLHALGVRVSPVILAKASTIPRTTSGKVQRARCRDSYDRGDLHPRVLAEID
ncbi:MAG TPA: AMP-binding protein [Candidatus Limnocylindrales bacterium]|nr:AMP-binding protein [Candidatus Limnocylindrales bacterium]